MYSRFLQTSLYFPFYRTYLICRKQGVGEVCNCHSSWAGDVNTWFPSHLQSLLSVAWDILVILGVQKVYLPWVSLVPYGCSSWLVTHSTFSHSDTLLMTPSPCYRLGNSGLLWIQHPGVYQSLKDYLQAHLPKHHPFGHWLFKQIYCESPKSITSPLRGLLNLQH